MTNQHQATPDDWAQQKDWANRSVFSDSSCIIELRDRIEALEIARLITHGITAEEVAPSSPAGSLLDRVADAIGAADDEGLTNMTWSNHSRAAILEVAAWLKEKGYSTLQAEALEQEANQ